MKTYARSDGKSRMVFMPSSPLSHSGHLKRASSQKGWVPPLFGSLGVVGGVIYLYTNQIYDDDDDGDDDDDD